MSTLDTRIGVVTSDVSDIPHDPRDCAVAHEIERQLPWAHYVSVGLQTINLWDYRCEHNPQGKIAGCDRCVGRELTWATPLRVAQAIKEFDRNGFATFPAFALREDEARVVPSRQDKMQKRQKMNQYNADVRAGIVKPQRKTAKAKARTKAVRRRS